MSGSPEGRGRKLTPEEMADLDGYEPSDFDRLSLHCTALEAEIDALQAENERFREFIRAFDDWRAGLMYPTPHPTENKAVAMIKARTALSEVFPVSGSPTSQ